MLSFSLLRFSVSHWFLYSREHVNTEGLWDTKSSSHGLPFPRRTDTAHCSLLSSLAHRCYKWGSVGRSDWGAANGCNTTSAPGNNKESNSVFSWMSLKTTMVRKRERDVTPAECLMDLEECLAKPTRLLHYGSVKWYKGFFQAARIKQIVIQYRGQEKYLSHGQMRPLGSLDGVVHVFLWKVSVNSLTGCLCFVTRSTVTLSFLGMAFPCNIWAPGQRGVGCKQHRNSCFVIPRNMRQKVEKNKPYEQWLTHL